MRKNTFEKKKVFTGFYRVCAQASFLPYPDWSIHRIDRVPSLITMHLWISVTYLSSKGGLVAPNQNNDSK
jgi:hypothetical protein